jgi:hypothetical protein
VDSVFDDVRIREALTPRFRDETLIFHVMLGNIMSVFLKLVAISMSRAYMSHTSSVCRDFMNLDKYAPQQHMFAGDTADT